MRTVRRRGMAGALVLLLAGCAGGPGIGDDGPGPRDVDAVPAGAGGGGAEVAEVLHVVHGLFDAMRAGDADRVQSYFHPDARLVTTAWRDGQPFVASVPAERFVRSVATAEGSLDEVIWDERVRIRDNLATVWTDYNFHLDGELHHCGVNAFQLVRTAEGWRIIHVADTRSQSGCEPR